MESSAPRQDLEPAGGASSPSGSVDPAVALCRDGEIVWASEPLTEMLGREDEPPLEGRPILDLLSEIGETIPALVVDEADSAQPPVYRIPIPDGDGERIVSVFQIEVAKAVGANAVELWLLRDIGLERDLESKNQRLDRELARSDARLDRACKELTQERDELIAMLSHELRTPLTVITGYSKLLLSEREGELSDEQRRYLEESRKSCQQLNDFVSDLLDAPHNQSGILSLSLEERPIVPSIRSVMQFFLPLLEEKSLKIQLDAPVDVPPARLDPERIQQVLTNLLGNAVKYTKAGSSIDIAVRQVAGGSGPMIEISVLDDGPGIASEDMQRIFEPYVRGTGEGRKGGVGLGLAICRRILEAHGGEIRAEAAPGRGSRFVFSVPAVVDPSLASER
jgi:signal transduction histidine kinase